MKRLLPGRAELAVLITMAFICTLVAAFSAKLDIALALMSMPLFLCGALMGMRRNGQLSSRQNIRE